MAILVAMSWGWTRVLDYFYNMKRLCLSNYLKLKKHTSISAVIFPWSFGTVWNTSIDNSLWYISCYNHQNLPRVEGTSIIGITNTIRWAEDYVGEGNNKVTLHKLKSIVMIRCHEIKNILLSLVISTWVAFVLLYSVYTWSKMRHRCCDYFGLKDIKPRIKDVIETDATIVSYPRTSVNSLFGWLVRIVAVSWRSIAG